MNLTNTIPFEEPRSSSRFGEVNVLPSVPQWWTQATDPIQARLKPAPGRYRSSHTVLLVGNLITRASVKTPSPWVAEVQDPALQAELVRLIESAAKDALAMERMLEVGINPYREDDGPTKTVENARFEKTVDAFLEIEARFRPSAPKPGPEALASSERQVAWDLKRSREARLYGQAAAKALYALDAKLGGTGKNPTLFWKAMCLPTAAFDLLNARLVPALMRFLLAPFLLGWLVNLSASCILLLTVPLAKLLSFPKEVAAKLAVRRAAASKGGRVALTLAAPAQVVFLFFAEVFFQIGIALRLAALPWWEALTIPSFVPDAVAAEEVLEGKSHGHTLSPTATKALRLLLPVWVVLSVPLLPIALLVRLVATWSWGLEGVYQCAPFWLLVWLPFGLIRLPFAWVLGGDGILDARYGRATALDLHPMGLIRGVTAPLLG